MSDYRNGTIENAFRALITEGWANQSDGDVEAPTGHFAIIDMTSERGMMQDVLDEADMPNVVDMIPARWYGVVEDSNGLVHWWELRDEATAEGWFATKLVQFAQWHDADENEG